MVLLDATSSSFMHDRITTRFFGYREVLACFIALACFPVEHAISTQNAIYEIRRNGLEFNTQTARLMISKEIRRAEREYMNIHPPKLTL